MSLPHCVHFLNLFFNFLIFRAAISMVCRVRVAVLWSCPQSLVVNRKLIFLKHELLYTTETPDCHYTKYMPLPTCTYLVWYFQI